jgi:hypothetical protein
MTIPRLIIPILAIVLMLGGYSLRMAFTNPTTNIEFAVEADGGEVATLEAIVDGVKCKGTAEYFTTLYENEAGILSITTFAAEHKALIDFDPSQITPEEIKAVMEQEITFRDGSKGQVFTCKEMNLKM